jgi:putative FmdB family regulatory protein
MPIYEYRCTECRNLHPEIHSMTDFPQESKCPACGASARKIISLPQKPIVDNVDREGYNVGLGRAFSNKRERQEFLKTTGFIETDPAEVRKAQEQRAADIESVRR